MSIKYVKSEDVKIEPNLYKTELLKYSCGDIVKYIPKSMSWTGNCWAIESYEAKVVLLLEKEENYFLTLDFQSGNLIRMFTFGEEAQVLA